ncbi:MAG: hypothetical protein NZT92_14560 [Abditibacteriales bacterium]|nr:hypothetical protein [Abditibacteriales bacterium]
MNPTFMVIGLMLLMSSSRQDEAMEDKARLMYLTETTKQLLAGCRVRAHDGTTLYVPDGKGHYKALWTRDFAYMVENAGDLMPPEDIEACIRYLLKGQRADGALPDRVRPDGVPVYVAGSEVNPLGEPNLDNPQFLVIAVDEYLKRIAGERRLTLFREWAPALDRGMNYIPRSERGLVYNDPQKPHSPYGFTDTVGKTGELFMESLLYWTACRRLTDWHEKAGMAALSEEYRRRAHLIEKNIDALWDETTGAFMAATQDCRQVDIWGNAYAIYLDFPLGAKRERVLQFLLDNYTRYVWRGQVRHLLKGTYWQRMLTPVERERYQNGAYWATASGWVMWALAQKNPTLARQMFADLIADFQQGGVCECVNEGYRQLESYVVSATNPLAAVRRLKWGT